MQTLNFSLFFQSLLPCLALLQVLRDSHLVSRIARCDLDVYKVLSLLSHQFAIDFVLNVDFCQSFRADLAWRFPRCKCTLVPFPNCIFIEFFHRLSGKLHRCDGPAFQQFYEDVECISEYHVDGKLHRDGDLPAVDGTYCKEWWYRGVRHRFGKKPAIITTFSYRWFKWDHEVIS